MDFCLDAALAAPGVVKATCDPWNFTSGTGELKLFIWLLTDWVSTSKAQSSQIPRCLSLWA